MLGLIFFALFLSTITKVAATAAGYVRMEPDVNLFSSTGWIREKKNVWSDSDIVKVIFVLKRDTDTVRRLDTVLWDVSNPSSANYGKFLKPEDIISNFSPSRKSLKIVTDFLESFGLTGENLRVSKYLDLVHVKLPVKLAEKMLQTEFGLFRSVTNRNVVIPRVTKPYYLPVEIADVVSLVDDIVRFPRLRQSKQSFASEENSSANDDTDPFSSCGTKCGVSGYTTPAVLQQAYAYPTLTKASAGNSMSVAEFQFQYYDNTDLKDFSNACGVTSEVDVTIGGNVEKICETGGCVEALLDIEYIEAVAHPVPLTVIYSSTYSILDYVDSLISMTNPPLVNSVSYGNDEVQQISSEYMYSVNTEFMKTGTLGLSILFASGDQGVWGRSGVGKTFHPDFPASSPYVTAVGGTDFVQYATVGAEAAWSCGGGGFSDTFSQPSYQSSAVESYLKKAAAKGLLPDSSFFNSTGRAYPDISALGGFINPYCVVHGGGKFGGVSGTSASTPVVAGIFAQLNNVRLAKGKSALGFLNPMIYSNPSCFNDVTSGTNNCNAGTPGFTAISGWDPATGFGSPNYACLAKVI